MASVLPVFTYMVLACAETAGVWVLHFTTRYALSKLAVYGISSAWRILTSSAVTPTCEKEIKSGANKWDNSTVQPFYNTVKQTSLIMNSDIGI